jgi:hypothetical protein
LPPWIHSGHMSWAFGELGSYSQLYQYLHDTPCERFDHDPCHGSDIFVSATASTLLSDFNLHKFRTAVGKLGRDTFGRQIFPEHVAWLQIYSLDLSIQRVLRDLQTLIGHKGPMFYGGDRKESVKSLSDDLATLASRAV